MTIHPTALIGEPPEHRDWNARGYRFHFPEIARSARIGAFVTIDSGVFRPTWIGENTWLMKHVHVGHDALIGDDCELAPGTVICGEVEIGNGCRFGVNSCVKPQVKIGDGARIGMGAVVTKDVPAGEVWIGNPADEIGRLKARREVCAELELWEHWWRERAREVFHASA